MKQFQLYYDQQRIALIDFIDADFPNISGKYILNQNIPMLISDYIKNSILYTIALEQGDPPDDLVAESNKLYKAISRNIWQLIEIETKTKHNILTPIFHTNNYIVWRWK